ncbi:MAG: GNAT family N-acetyltransferase [Litorilinea sp.]
MQPIRRLAPAEYPRLEQALGDTPATVIPLHQLRIGAATATCVGPVNAPDAVVIQANAEPTAFATDAAAGAAAVAAILSTLHDWYCVECAADLGTALAAHYAQTQVACRLYADLYYTLAGPLRALPPPPLETRLLTLADIPAWRAAPPEFQELGFAAPVHVLARGHAAGSFAHGKLVALAHTSALSARYADVGVYTAPDYRGRGLAAAVAHLVMQRVLAQGRTPLWSTGEDNLASQRVAHKLGLETALQRVYVILDSRA